MNFPLLKKVLTDNAEALANMSALQKAQYLNTPRVTQRVERLVQKRTLFSLVGVLRGVQVLLALQALSDSATDPVQKRVYFEIYSLIDNISCGLDISVDESRTFVDQFVRAGILTADEGVKIKAYGEKLISLAEAAGLTEVAEGDVAQAEAL